MGREGSRELKKCGTQLGQPDWAVPSTMGCPHLPRLKEAWVPDVSAGKERQGEESCQQAQSAVALTPTPVQPVLKLLFCHQPVHPGVSEVPVALRHRETERSLEPDWALQASPGFFPEYNAPCPDV